MMGASRQVGITPRFEEAPAGDRNALILALNLERRHLTVSQRAALADALATVPWGGARGKALKEALPAIGREEAAALAHVSVTSLERFRRLKERAAAHVVDAVARGSLSLPEGERLATLEPDVQAVLVDLPEMKDTAAAILRAQPAHGMKAVAKALKEEYSALRDSLADPLEAVYAEAILRLRTGAGQWKKCSAAKILRCCSF
jgi:hypothetical protein